MKSIFWSPHVSSSGCLKAQLAFGWLDVQTWQAAGIIYRYGTVRYVHAGVCPAQPPAALSYIIRGGSREILQGMQRNAARARPQATRSPLLAFAATTTRNACNDRQNIWIHRSVLISLSKTATKKSRLLTAIPSIRAGDRPAISIDQSINHSISRAINSRTICVHQVCIYNFSVLWYVYQQYINIFILHHYEHWQRYGHPQTRMYIHLLRIL